MIKKLLILIFTFNFLLVYSQTTNTISGNISGQENDSQTPLVGAGVYWLENMQGVTTDENGDFSIKKNYINKSLIISYLGYKSDTVNISGKSQLSIVLLSSAELDEFEVINRTKTTSINFTNTIKVETISTKELLKAACCNLSESFETNPSIDVSFTDAVTGTRQIQLLGLAGSYTQITRENMPDVRGLSSIYGLQFIPGAWIESILLNKGAGSVINGFESITGQINVNLWRPQNMPKLHLNLYTNESGRIEGNANIRAKLSDEWSTALLLHFKSNSIKHDKNKDGFMDMPIGDNYIFVNRWNYNSENGTHFEFGTKATYMETLGGQTNYNFDLSPQANTAWGMTLNTKRYEGWMKLGKVNPNKPHQSVGFQLSATTHQQNSNFGQRIFNAQQDNVYANLIFQSNFSSTKYLFKTGISFMYDNYKEDFDLQNFDRKEIVPGAFFEYIHHQSDNISLVGGIRLDHHNLYGLFITPRIHTRFALGQNTVLRIGGGRGQRTANIITENSGLLASSRQFIIQNQANNYPYGLEPEVAWNYGLNFTHEFKLDYREGVFSMEFYRTDFENQIVVDIDKNASQVWFSNLDGKSTSNSFQVQLDYEVIKRLDARIAYRWFDVKTDYSSGLLEKPFVSKHRAFINLAYATKNHWKFDYTINWQGKKRISSTATNPTAYQLENYSPDYFLMNGQISKVWNEKLDIYLGVENLLNFKQEDPIVSVADPFSDFFDASMIWGPVFGRKVYLGLRYTLR